MQKICGFVVRRMALFVVLAGVVGAVWPHTLSWVAPKVAWMLGIAPARHVFGTDAGPIEAEVDPDSNQVTVQLTPPKDLRLV